MKKGYFLIYSGLFMLMLLTFSGCGGCEDSGSSKIKILNNTKSLKGLVIDGAIENALVCLDINKNQKCEKDEPSSHTKKDGSFEISLNKDMKGEYKVISIGGTDTATNTEFEGVLENFVEIEKGDRNITSLVSPLTTLSAKLYEQNKKSDINSSWKNSKKQLANSLNLTVDELTSNPLKNKKVFAKTQKIIQTTRLIRPLIKSQESNQTLFSTILTHIAQNIGSESEEELNITSIIDSFNGTEIEIKISDSIKEYIQKYISQIENKVLDSNDSVDPYRLQGGIEYYVNNTINELKNNYQNLTSSLDRLLNNFSQSTPKLLSNLQGDVPLLVERINDNNKSKELISQRCHDAGGIAIYTGFDSNRNGFLDNNESKTDPYIICNGVIGYTSLIEMDNISSSTECPNGGVAINSGLDINRNAQLDSDEIKNTLPICNGTTGATGELGSGSTTIRSKTATIEGKIELSSLKSNKNLKSGIFSKITSQTGSLWLTPDAIMSAIEADLNRVVQNTAVVPTPPKPIKIEVKPDGSYKQAEILSGTNYTLSYIDASGKGTRLKSITLKAGKTVVKNIKKSELLPTGNVQFTLQDLLNSSHKLSNATIKLLDFNLEVNSSADGTARFNNLPKGEYAMIVKAKGYVNKYVKFNILSGKTVNLQAIELSSKKGSLSGTINVDGLSNYTNVVLYAKAPDGSIFTTISNESGNYLFSALPVGEGYSIIATAHDYKTTKVDNLIIKDSKTTIAPNMILTQTPIKVSANSSKKFQKSFQYKAEEASSFIINVGSIEGFARFKEVKEFQHAGIIISLEGTDFEAITARDGSFVLNNIPEGKYTLNITDSNHKTVTKKIDVVNGASTRLDSIEISPIIGNLEGVVKDEAGNVIPNANIVVLTNSSTLTTLTDSNGIFRINGIIAGTHQVNVIKDGYGAGSTTVTILENQTTKLPTDSPIVLARKVLTGRVLLNNHTSHEGVQLSLIGSDVPDASTQKNGNFTFYGVEKGNYQLQVTKAGFISQIISLTVNSDNGYIMPYDITLSEAIGTLSGIIDIDNKADKSGVTVSIKDTAYTTTTNALGAWSMPIGVGSYSNEIRFTHANYNTETYSNEFNISASNVTTIPLVTMTPKLGSLKVKVTDGNNGLDNVLIKMSDGTTSHTDKNGIATIPNLAVGEQTVTASKDGYGIGTLSVTIVAGKTQDATTTPITLSELLLTGKVNLQGMENNAGARVKILDSTRVSEVSTDSNGNFTLSGVSAGNYQLQIEKSGFVTKIIPITVTSNDGYAIPYTIELVQSLGTLSGIINIDNRADKSGVIVSIKDTSYTTTTNALGAWSIPIRVGSYSNDIQFSHPNYNNQLYTRDFNISASSVTNIPSVTLIPKLGSIKIRVTDGNNPVNNVLIRSTDGISSHTDKNGTVTLNSLTVGEQTITASKDGYGIGTLSVKVEAGKVIDMTSTPITLSQLLLTGKVNLQNKSDNAGVKIKILDLSRVAEVSTNSAGEFTLTGVSAGNYQLQIQKDGFVTKVISIAVIDNNGYAIPYTIELIEAFGSLSGIIDIDNKVDKSGVRVSIENTSYSTITNALGAWAMSLPVGDYTKDIIFTHSNYTTKKYENDFNISASNITNIPLVTLSPKLGSVKVKVIDAKETNEANKSIANVNVYVQGGKAFTTDSNGTATISDLAVGETYNIIASKDGYAPSSLNNVLIKAGETIDLTDQPIKLVKQVLYGKVSKGNNVDDHSGIAVKILGESLYAISDKNGTFYIAGIPSHDIAIEFSAGGFKTKTIIYNVKKEGFEVPLQIMESARISGTSLSINQNETVTNNRTVKLSIKAFNAVKMKISENLSFENTEAIDYRQEYDYNLSEGDGIKSVYVRVFDATVSQERSELVSDSIKLDTTPPTILDVTLLSGNHITNSKNIRVFPQYDGTKDNNQTIKLVKIYDENNTEHIFPYSVNGIDWTLPKTTNQSIRLKLVDITGNESAMFTQAITYDDTPSELSKVTVIGSNISRDYIYLAIESLDEYVRVEVSDNANFTRKQTFYKGQDIKFRLSGEDGSKTLYVRIVDNAENLSKVLTQEVTYDTTPPTKVVIETDSNTLSNETEFEMRLTKGAEDVNFNYYETRIDNREWKKASTDQTEIRFIYQLNESAINKLQIRAVDKAGNIGDTSSILIRHDKDALITKATPSAGYYNQDITVKLVSKDEKYIYYTTDGSKPTQQSNIFNANLPILFSDEGEHILKYFAVNEEGQKESIKTSIYHIDKTAPIIEFNPYKKVSNKDIVLDLNMSETNQMSLRYEITNDNSEPPKPSNTSSITYSHKIPITQEGKQIKVKVIGVDEAGNESNILFAILRIDRTAPRISEIPDGGLFSMLTGKIIKIKAIDIQDQDPKIYYTLDGSTPTVESTQLTKEFNLSTIGVYELKAFAVDDLNNSSEIVSRTYRIGTVYDDTNRIITNDINWTKEFSPYAIYKDVYIKNRAKLNIEAGVEIELYRGSGIYVEDGSLKAIGSNTEPIKFTRKDNYYATNSLSFSNNSLDATFDKNGKYLTGSTIQHSKIIDNVYATALYTEESSPYFSDISINNAYNGLYFYNSQTYAKNIDINNTQTDAILAHGSNCNVNLEYITIKNYNSNAIESYDNGSVVNITKSDISHILNKTMLYTYNGGSINSLENNYHTYNIAVLEEMIKGDNIQYAPMLSEPLNIADFDKDGIFDINDTDDDNDGYTDIDEAKAGTSQFLATGVGLPLDTDEDNISNATDIDDDGDGFKDKDEISVDSDPLNPNSQFDILTGQDIQVDTTLPKSNNTDTILIKGNILVARGTTLTIRAGTKIFMNGNYSFQVHGAIKFMGTTEKPITISPKLPSSSWNENHFDGIIFYNDSTPLVIDENKDYVSGSLIQHTNINYAGSVVAAIYKDEYSTTSGFAYLDHVNIDNSKNHAIRVKKIENVIMRNVNISHNQGDNTIFVENSSIVVTDSTFNNNMQEVFHLNGTYLELNNSNFNNNLDYAMVWARDSLVNSNNNSFLNDRAAFYLYNNTVLNSTNDTIDEMKPSGYLNGAIDIRNNSQAKIVNLNLKKSNHYGIFASSAKLVDIIDSNITNCNSYGYYNKDNAYTVVKGSNFINNKDGIRIDNGYFVKLEENNISNNREYGVVIEDIEDMASKTSILVSQNTIENNGKYGLWTNTSPDIRFNTITSNAQGGLFLSGDNAKPDFRYNNIFANSTINDADNENFDIRNDRSIDLILLNNYHGTTNAEELSIYSYDKLDKADRGRIYFYNYLNTPIDIVNKTSKDSDGDGIMDIYDNDDDDDGRLDRIETDNDNGNLDPFVADSDKNATVIDTDRDGVLDDEDTDDDNDGLSDDNESVYGTNPQVADTDGDGMNDATEVANGSDPLVVDGLGGTLYEDTVIHKDTYVADLVIPSGVTLSSDNNSTLFALNSITLRGGTLKDIAVDGMGRTKDYSAIIVEKPVVLRNLDIRNAYIGIQANADLKLYDSHIEDVTTAIKRANSTTINIENSSLSNGVKGIDSRDRYNGSITVKQSELSDFSDKAMDLYNADSVTLNISNALFRNNNYGVYGYDTDSVTYTISQSTFDNNNRAVDSDYNYGTWIVEDSLFTNNNVTIDNIDTHTNNVYYNNISGIGDDTTEKTTTVNPFKDSLLGYTTAQATVDGDKTTLTDTTLNLSVNELAGVYLQPNATQRAKYRVLSNTKDTITIDGVLTGENLDVNNSYTLVDFVPKKNSIAKTASSSNGVVGAFDGINNPTWSYMVYSKAQPTTNGLANSNEIWRGTVTLTGSVEFGATKHLRIERGTKVVFAENNASQTLTINSMGGIESQEDNNSVITFTSANENNNSAGQWRGVVLNKMGKLTNIKIEKANIAIEVNSYLKLYSSHIENVNTAIKRANSTTLVIENSSLSNGVKGIDSRDRYNGSITVKQSELSDFSDKAMDLYNADSVIFNISNALFRNNNYGIYGWDTDNVTYNITQSTFDNNNRAVDKNNYYGTWIVKDCLFTNNNVAIDEINTHTNNVYYNSGSIGTSTGEIQTDDPYVDIFIGNLHIKDAHQAKSASSTGGEVGVYGGGVGDILPWITYGTNNGVTDVANRTKFGEMKENQYWSGDTNLTGDLVIPRGKILKLDANSRIFLPSGNKIVVNGDMMLLSSEGNEVIFDGTSSTPNSQSWDGLKIKSIGGIYKYLIVKHAQNGIDLTSSKGVTLSHVKVIDSNSTGITATGGATVEDSAVWGTLNESGSQSVGIKVKGDATVRRNVVANAYRGVSVENYNNPNIFINHNLIVRNNIGIYTYSYYYSYNKAQIFYNTIDSSAKYGIYLDDDYNNNNIIIKYNILTNSGTSAIYANKNYDIEINGFYNNNDSNYTGGVTPSTNSFYPDLGENPNYSDVSNSITKENIGYGIYGDLSDDYHVTNTTYQSYTPYNSKMGAYNIISYVDTNFIQNRTDIEPSYNITYVKNGTIVSGIIKTSLPNMDIEIDPTELDNGENGSVEVESSGYTQNYTFTISDDNTKAEGNYSIKILATYNNDTSISNNINYPFNLDNTGATVTLNDFTDGSTITENKTIHLNITDNFGAVKYQYSTDQGDTWTTGATDIVLSSGGENDGNTADITINGVNVSTGELGFNVVELNRTNFSYINSSKKTFVASNVDAFTTYLNNLADDSVIAFVVKSNGRDGNGNRHNNLINALRKFDFEGDFTTNDSVAFIGIKGGKYNKSITKIVKSGEGLATIDTAEYGKINPAVTLDSSCYNDDGNGNCTVQARGVDLLGNVGEVLTINYKVQ